VSRRAPPGPNQPRAPVAGRVEENPGWEALRRKWWESPWHVTVYGRAQEKDRGGGGAGPLGGGGVLVVGETCCPRDRTVTGHLGLLRPGGRTSLGLTAVPVALFAPPGRETALGRDEQRGAVEVVEGGDVRWMRGKSRIQRTNARPPLDLALCMSRRCSWCSSWLGALGYEEDDTQRI